MNEIRDTLYEWLDWFENPVESVPPALADDNAFIGYESRGFVSNRFICRFETEAVDFDVRLLMNDEEGEADASAIVKLALISLSTAFPEKVTIRVSDELADYNGGSLEDFLLLIDRLSVTGRSDLAIVLP